MRQPEVISVEDVDPNRDAKGRFVAGNSVSRKGSRNKLGEHFLADLHEEWLKSGPDALARLSLTDPGAFVRVVAQVLPREVEVEFGFDPAKAAQFAHSFRLALQVLSGEEPPLIEADSD